MDAWGVGLLLAFERGERGKDLDDVMDAWGLTIEPADGYALAARRTTHPPVGGPSGSGSAAGCRGLLPLSVNPGRPR